MNIDEIHLIPKFLSKCFKLARMLCWLTSPRLSPKSRHSPALSQIQCGEVHFLLSAVKHKEDLLIKQINAPLWWSSLFQAIFLKCLLSSLGSSLWSMELSLWRSLSGGLSLELSREHFLELFLKVSGVCSFFSGALTLELFSTRGFLFGSIPLDWLYHCKPGSWFDVFYHLRWRRERMGAVVREFWSINKELVSSFIYKFKIVRIVSELNLLPELSVTHAFVPTFHHWQARVQVPSPSPKRERGIWTQGCH